MQNASAGLWRDHEVLRDELAVLDEWLPFAPAVSVPIHHLTAAIASRLRTHMEREDVLFSMLRELLRERPDAISPRLLDRYEEHHKIGAALIDMLVNAQDLPPNQLSLYASNVIKELRQEMTEEEQQLFPLIDSILRALPDRNMPERVRDIMADREVGEDACVITPAMTVNRILKIHPSAMSIFHRFGIDVEVDGGCWIDELRWRRGLDVAALLLALNQSLGVKGWAERVPELLWGSCDGMMVIDDQGRVLAMNPAMERMTGRSSGEVVGQFTCAELFGCQDFQGRSLAGDAAHCPGLKAMRQGKADTSAEFVIRDEAGRRIGISASYTPVRPHPDGSTWALVVMRDIGMRQVWERRRHRRVAVRAPVLICSGEGTPKERWEEGTVDNLSLDGAHLTIATGDPLAVKESLAFSIVLEPAQQSAFPYSRLAGHGRIIRLEPAVAPALEESESPVGVAVEFASDLTALPVSSGNGK